MSSSELTTALLCAGKLALNYSSSDTAGRFRVHVLLSGGQSWPWEISLQTGMGTAADMDEAGRVADEIVSHLIHQVARDLLQLEGSTAVVNRLMTLFNLQSDQARRLLAAEVLLLTNIAQNGRFQVAE